ncbi:MAG: rod shape-determining protein MreC [Actinomycetota bacterium]
MLLLAFLALSLVIITLDFRAEGDGPLERAKDISTTVVAPIQRGLTAVFRPVGDFFSSLGDLSRLRVENEELREALDAAEGQIERAEALESENVELRDISNLTEPYTSMEDVTAEVIATVPANYRWAVKIDKGSIDGIKEDMAVIAEDGLVGKIIRADPTSSIVLLLIDPNAGAAARIEDKGDAGNIRGNGADEPLSMRGVDPEAKVRKDDTIVTSGYDGGIFPPSIPIGRVIRASGESAMLEQEIDVESFVDFNTLDFVRVLLESGPRLDERTEDKQPTAATEEGE